MILLTTTNEVLRVVTDAAGTIEALAAWADNNAGTVTPGSTSTADITTATTTTIVAAPGSSQQRSVLHVLLRNEHASQAVGIDVQHYNGTIARSLFKCTLAAGESVYYEDGVGWVRLNSSGVPIAGANTGAADVQVFTSSGNWVKPTTFTPKVVIVEAI